MITPLGGIRTSGSRLCANSIIRRPVLEQVAYAVEQNDHRGTFYFAQLATAASKQSKGLVGFHGAGGGGLMMSMDAIVNAGFTTASLGGARRADLRRIDQRRYAVGSANALANMLFF